MSRVERADTRTRASPISSAPTLAMAGAGEGGETAAQFERYWRAVSGPVTRRTFRAAEGADMHCQVGNLSLSNAVVYDWISEVFRK
jgi:hypothetical protein